MFELEKGVVLRDLVVEILRPGPRSISQVGKALAERGVRLHRLAVAGYLKAMADASLLEEREIPPAKVYALRPGASKRDLYRTVGELVREHASPTAEPVRVYVQALWDLFRRPIFREELRRGGFDPGPGLGEAGGEERQAARRFLSRSAVKLPFNDPAYTNRFASGKEEAAIRDQARAVLNALVREDYRAGALSMTTKQATLGEG